jgi:hypothetical protein
MIEYRQSYVVKLSYISRRLKATEELQNENTADHCSGLRGTNCSDKRRRTRISVGAVYAGVFFIRWAYVHSQKQSVSDSAYQIMVTYDVSLNIQKQIGA